MGEQRGIVSLTTYTIRARIDSNFGVKFFNIKFYVVKHTFLTRIPSSY
jgi:hypothetical protein